jgi:hypothetical protein
VGYENDTNNDYTHPTITTTTTALVASGATVIPVASVTNMAVGMPIAATGIPATATIQSISALNVTIAPATTASIALGATITVTGTPPLGVGPLPPHSVSLVVQGGDAVQICDTILLKKTPGCYTYGTTRETVNDIYGLPHNIGFFVPTTVQIGVAITLTAKAGYSTIVGAGISQTVADYINGLGSGVSVVYSKLWLPANLCDSTTGLPSGATNTYDITAMTIASPPTGTYGTANIAISIFQIAQCTAANVVITAH